jgi:hypothetical protein
MKLLTKALKKRFAKIGCQEKSRDPIIVAKFFNPTGSGTWYATEYYPDARMFFGYADIFVGEWGYFSLRELESFKGAFGLGIERDLYWTEKRFSEQFPESATI